MKEILIVGINSNIGKEIGKILESKGKKVLGTTRIPEHATQSNKIYLDLSKDVTEWEIPQNTDTVFFCTSVSNLKECRLNPTTSETVNVTSTLSILEKLAKNGVHTVFPSSTLVFDGSTPFQKTEDKKKPLTVYGKQKAKVEKRLGELPCNSIIRLSKVLGENVPLFYSWIKRMNQSQDIHPFSDMKISPIPLKFVANFMISIAEKRHCGIFHAGGNKDISYYEIAHRIARKLGTRLSLVKETTAKKNGIPENEIPLNTTLDTASSYSLAGMESPDVWDTISKSTENL